jgi:dephospho-CoA kinase
MLVVGLTGGTGSGKSTVADLFAAHGIPIIDADVIAREITLPSTPAFHAILAHFGPSILQSDGSLDRQALRHIIFDDNEARAWLENTLHPLILEQIKQRISLISAPYCLVVIPLLAEKGSYTFINRILVVDASQQLQIERIRKRDHSDIKLATAIVQSQATREKRLKLADDIILNDGDLADLLPQVERLHTFYAMMVG